jgi:hypothetical protein
VRSVEFHPEAQDEFISAAQFYDRETRGSGLEFISTGLLYCVEPDRIYVVAVMHLHRRPGYWRSRL